MTDNRAKKLRLDIQNKLKGSIPVIASEDGKETIAMDNAFADAQNGIGSNIFAIGSQVINDNLFGWYISQGFIGYQACAILAQNWLVEKACTQKGKDAARKWFRVSVNDGEEVDEKKISLINELDKKFKLKENLIEASKFNNVFGIRHIMFLVDSPDPDYYSKPFNPDGIRPGTYKGISQIDPYWLSPHLSKDGVATPTGKDFYVPEYWTIGGIKVHKSHLVVLTGEEVADFLKPSYLYGGLSLTQRIYERVYAAERTANEAPQLAMTKRLNVQKVDVKKAVANQAEFEQANRTMQEYRDNFGTLFIGQEEEFMQLDTALADLDTTIMTQYQIVAAIADTPSTKLLGTSPKGFNATGEHETTSYHETLESVQESIYDPIVEMHHKCLQASYPELKGFDMTVNWNPLSTESRKEKAEVNELKSRTAQQYANVGAVDNYDIRQEMINDPDSGYDGMEMPDESEMEEMKNDAPDADKGIENE